MQRECARACVWLCVSATTRHPPISSMFCYSVIQLGIIPPAQPRRTALNVNNWIFISPPCLGKSHPGQTCFTSLFLHRLIRICQITNIRSLIPPSMLRAALSVSSPWRPSLGALISKKPSNNCKTLERMRFALEMYVTHAEMYSITSN